ncbi:carboxymuconolactone decarboxylase family protein [Streptomyces klenkii]|uniref:Carboxymuconolactone decarboxylase family protein n=1 Tax=Streptomyces klenkii TaxID=1420899 RepID=A0A3B0BDS4_9ACTN|nr:carboxymuconolactone decarboxylase family protein [Streptomyces klenkii]RKN70237.1 carboxymuconolactone decarboxylase family protein [Streptomyces klenkii]
MTNTNAQVTGHHHAPRMLLHEIAPEVGKAMLSLERAARKGLETSLIELVKIRASQLNRCAFCLDMHTKDARKLGESEERIYLLNAWHEAPGLYTEKEQAALALTEAVTLLPGGVSDEVYERAAKHFPQQELAQLIAMITTINAWNRIGVTTGLGPGAYAV